METPTRLLKHGPRRSVLLERSEGGWVVVKRFHHPHPLRALRDRARARAELRNLTTLHQRGLRVPRPIGLARGDQGWEVRMEPVPGALVLEQLFSRREVPPGGWDRLCTRLGRLLADLHRTRLHHPDLHRGNVLIDAGGDPWLVDFHEVRGRGRAPDTARRRADLIAATAAGREHLPARTRVRFALAWRAALPRELAPAKLDLDDVERRARAHRREVVERGAGRWLRPSSRARVERTPGAVVFERRRPADRTPAPRQRLFELELASEEARARWLVAARLHEHALPTARPARLVLRQRRATLTLELPGERSAEEPLPRDLGRLLGALHDRGLDPARLGPGDVVATGAGPALVPPSRLAAVDPLELGEERFRALAQAGVRVDEAVRRAYLEAFAGAPREQKAIARRLR